MIEEVYTRVIRSEQKSCVGQKEPVAHPCNCRSECPYGYGRAYCYPCLALILRSYRRTEVKRNEERES